MEYISNVWEKLMGTALVVLSRLCFCGSASDLDSDLFLHIDMPNTDRKKLN